ncbi:HipA domain-containing protein [Poseidonocella sp. HB161398]|uniref:HipA domain-containing protein n=1 Tax=Poseidonocella sp. HB161398 TaxID=2320855 RepID=UPI001108BF09|nr:HipA domain-containing protein [Poseidonocella sp. HB161398]
MRLDVWMEGLDSPAGSLVRARDRSLSFVYAVDAPAEARISAAMPVREEPYGDAACVAYFGNLLFEGRELDRIMDGFGIDRDDIGALLHHLGADCPGAISVTPEGTGPGKRPGRFPDDYEELSQDDLRRLMVSLHFRGRLPEGAGDPSPLAGVQPKLALVARDGRYFLPREGSRAPTTHVLKVSPRDDADLTRHEAALLSLARNCKLDVIESSYVEIDDEETCASIGALLSCRFDRAFDGRTVRRIHSEDFAQALGLPRSLKYERDAVIPERRFSLEAVGRLALGTVAPAKFQLEFLAHTLFNLAVGNTDNHAKNGAILYDGQAGRLAPLYDVVPVMMDRRVTHAFSALIGGASYAEDLTVPALEAAFRDLGFLRARMSGSRLKLLRDIAKLSGPILERESGKSLADAVATQMRVIEGATGLDLHVPQRDFYPRQTRDEAALTVGWGGLS